MPNDLLTALPWIKSLLIDDVSFIEIPLIWLGKPENN